MLFSSAGGLGINPCCLLNAAAPQRRPWRGPRWRRPTQSCGQSVAAASPSGATIIRPLSAPLPLIGQEAAGSRTPAGWPAADLANPWSCVQEPRPCQSLTLLPRFADIPWYLRQNGGTAMVGLPFGALTVETRRPECVLGIVGIVVVLSLLTVLSSTHSASFCSKVAFCIVFGRKLIVACSCLAVGALLAAAWLAGNDERRPRPSRQIWLASFVPQRALKSPAPLPSWPRHPPTAVCVTAHQSKRPRTIWRNQASPRSVAAA
jgi:hypothetical protein